MRTGLFITARLKSSRLPGKLLLPLAGKSVFEHVLERARLVSGVDVIVVCTSTNPQDDPLVTLSTAQNIDCFRGSEDDVLKRLLLAAEKHRCDYIVSMTADNPLFSITHAEELVDAIRDEQADYYRFEDGLPLGTAPYAVSKLAFSIIDELKDETETEFWPEYLKDGSVFTHLVLPVAEEYRLDARLTIDYDRDYELFTRIYENYETRVPLELKSVIERLRGRDDLLRINSDITRSWLPQSRADHIRSVVESNKAGILRMRRSDDQAKV